MDDFERYIAEKDRIRNSINSHILSMVRNLSFDEFKHIIDIGSGTGVTPLTLASRYDKKIICIDIDKTSLDVLKRNSEAMGLTDKIEVKQIDMRNISYPDNYFDLIISEGSVQFIGFERALEEWGNMLRNGGYLIIHTDIYDKDERLREIKENDYELISLAEISKEEWLNSYLIPLSELIRRTSSRYNSDMALKNQLEKDSAEVQMALEDVDSLATIIYLLEKK